MKRAFCAGLIGLIFLAGGLAQAMFVPPQMVPMDRLIHSAQAYLKKHPDDAEAYYTLGRIYYLAFTMKRDSIPAFPDDEKTGKAEPASDWMVGMGDNRSTPSTPSSYSDLTSYAVHARHEFNEAIKRDQKNGLYYLGLASLLEEVRAWTEKSGYTNELADMETIDVHQLRQLYQKAFTLSIAEDSKQKTMPLAGLMEIVIYEAAVHLTQLAHEGEFQTTEVEDAKNSIDVIAKFEKLPVGAITPIVFSFSPGNQLAQFLAPQRVVDFDLRGYGLREQWSWIKPTLGILVWDPLHTGKITSARQLFGSYSFQIFRATGYDALSALDDNGDGVLSGAELKGVSVWFDRNSNGVSDPGEVIPVENWNIRSISVQATGKDGIYPTNAAGIVLNDGRVYRSWDWITEPARVVGTRGMPLAFIDRH